MGYDSSNNNNQQNIQPLYADEGRKQRVEQIGGRAELAWHQHCLAHGMRFEPLADDRVSTRESCCKPDVLTNGRATELMAYDWGNKPFPFRFLKIPYHKLKYGEEYPSGKFVMLNHEETYAVSVPMTEDVDFTDYCDDNYGKPMKQACYAVGKCHRFKLGKIDPLKN